MGKKKIAVLTDGWKRLITYAWILGIEEANAQSGEDVSIFQFNCQGNWSPSRAYNQGEYKIFSLPQLEEYDGIILDATNIEDDEVMKQLIQSCKKANVPVISIGRDIPEFYYVGVDSYTSISEIFEHLYEVHGCRNFIFAGGPKDNCENQLREAAYLDCLKAHNLDEFEHPVWYGGFDFESGVQYFEHMVKTKEAMPDAFICANDSIATGLLLTAKRYGYKVPEDFLITGFDFLEQSIYLSPQLTTVSQKREEIGRVAMEILQDIWNGKEFPHCNYAPCECIFTESCGCDCAKEHNYPSYIEQHILSNYEKQKNEDKLAHYENRLAMCNTFEEVFQSISDYFLEQECDGVGIVIDKRLYQLEDLEILNMEDYQKDYLDVVAFIEHGVRQNFQSVDQMMRYLHNRKCKQNIFFSPLHFHEKTIGFLLIENGGGLFEGPYYNDIQILIMKTLLSLYQRLKVTKMHEQLKDIYNKDQLTGVYNRVAYTDMIEPQFQSFCLAGSKCAIGFVDADHFKQINDTYGHERGDQILIEIAQTLSRECPNDGYVYRYGGDEFVIFYPDADENQMLAFKNQITAQLEQKQISISMGIALTNPLENHSIDYYLSLTDQDMYETKQARKGKKNS